MRDGVPAASLPRGNPQYHPGATPAGSSLDETSRDGSRTVELDAVEVADRPAAAAAAAAAEPTLEVADAPAGAAFGE